MLSVVNKRIIKGLLSLGLAMSVAPSFAFSVSYFWTGSDVDALTQSEAWNKSPITRVVYFKVGLDSATGDVTRLSEAQLANYTKMREWARKSKPRRQMIVGIATSAQASFLLDASLRDSSAKQAVEYMRELGGDGINADIEYPNTAAEQYGQQEYYKKLRAYLGNKVHLSVDVGPKAWMSAPGGHLSSRFASNNMMSEIWLMSYGSGNANTTAFAKNFVKEYTDKGTPRSRIVLGLPFYGKPAGEWAQCYKTLARQLPAGDTTTDLVNFRGKETRMNNVATITEKVKWAKAQGLGGVMTWHWSCDNEPTDAQTQSLTKGIAAGLK